MPNVTDGKLLLTGVAPVRSGACAAAAVAAAALSGADSGTGVAPLGGKSVSSDGGVEAAICAGGSAGVAVAGFFVVVCANAAPGSVNQTMAVRANRFMLFT